MNREPQKTEETDIELEMTYLRQESSGTTVEEEGQLDAFSLS